MAAMKNQTQPIEPKYLDIPGAAKLLGVSPGFVYRLLRKGLPHYKVGSLYRLEAAKIHAWLERNEVRGESSEEE